MLEIATNTTLEIISSRQYHDRIIKCHCRVRKDHGKPGKSLRFETCKIMEIVFRSWKFMEFDFGIDVYCPYSHLRL